MGTESDDDSERTTACSRCGRLRSDDPPAQRLAWMVEFTDGRKTWLCPGCSRQHVRDIEGKLPSEYW